MVLNQKLGKVKEELLDDAVRRILRVKYQLGLFEDPYKYCDQTRSVTIQIALTHNKFLPELSILMQLDQILVVFQFQIS